MTDRATLPDNVVKGLLRLRADWRGQGVETLGTALVTLQANSLTPGESISASAISFDPTGGVSSDTIQEAVAELDLDKSPVGHGHVLSDIVGLVTALAGKVQGDANWPASQIIVTPAGSISSSNLAAALAELDAEKSAVGHVHTAGTVVATPTGGLSATDVQAALAELDAEKSPVGHGHAASAITVVPTGTVASTNVQAALAELDAEKTPFGHGHSQSDVTGLVTALAGKVAGTSVGAPGGVAGLDAGGLLSSTALPTLAVYGMVADTPRDWTLGLDGAQTDEPLKETMRGSVSIFQFIQAAHKAGVRDRTGTVNLDYALLKAAKSGRKVRFPPGTYLHSGSITGWTSYTQWLFEPGAALKRNADTYGLFFDTPCNKVTIRGLEYDGQSATFNASPGGYHAIYVPPGTTSVTNLTIRDFDIHDVSGAGILILGGSGVTRDGFRVQDGLISRVGYQGFNVQDYCHNVWLANVRVVDVSLLSQDGSAITIGRSGRNHTVVGCYVDQVLAEYATNISRHGISVDNYENANVIGNIIKSAKGYGVEVGFGKGLTVANNKIDNCYRAAIGCSGNAAIAGQFNEHVEIIGNSGDGNNQGVYVFINNADGVMKQKDFVIVGNNFRNCVGPNAYGYWLSNVIGLLFVGNYARNCAGGGVFSDNAVDYAAFHGNFALQNTGVGIDIRTVAARSASSTGVLVGMNFAVGNTVADQQTWIDASLFPLPSIIRIGSVLSGVRPANVIGNTATPGSGPDIGALRLRYHSLQLDPVTATLAANPAPDMGLNNAATGGSSFKWTLGANVTVPNPTGLTINQILNIEFDQDATGGRTVAWGTAYKFNPATPWSNTGNTANTTTTVSFLAVGSSKLMQISPQNFWI